MLTTLRYIRQFWAQKAVAQLIQEAEIKISFVIVIKKILILQKLLNLFYRFVIGIYTCFFFPEQSFWWLEHYKFNSSNPKFKIYQNRNSKCSNILVLQTFADVFLCYFPGKISKLLFACYGRQSCYARALVIISQKGQRLISPPIASKEKLIDFFRKVT